jgi:hypothetical protein
MPKFPPASARIARREAASSAAGVQERINPGENMKFRAMFAAALLCAASTAVEAKKYVLPTPVAQELPVEVMLGQHEIAIDTPDNSALGQQAGLVGALIGMAISNAQAKTAETRVADVRNLLVDYNFNRRFEQALRAKLASEGLSPNPRVTILDTPWDAWLERSGDAMAAADKAGHGPATGIVMKVTPRFALEYTMQAMYVSMGVSLVDRQRKANGKFKEKFLDYRTYRFSIPMDSAFGAKPEINARRWLAVGNTEIARLLDLGIEQTTDMLAYDFSSDGRAEAARKVGKKESAKFRDRTVSGRQLRTGDSWYWTRSRPQVWHSITGTNLIAAEAGGNGLVAPAAASATAVQNPPGEAPAAPAADAAAPAGSP